MSFLVSPPEAKPRPWWFWVLLSIPSILALAFGALMTQHQSDIAVVHLRERLTYPDSKFKSLLGMPVHYRVRSTGKPLILLHGTGSSLHTWEGWTKVLADDFQIITVDLPGFGLTGPHPRRDYSLGTYIDFLDSLVQHLGLDSFAVGGNSLGGAIAWNYALLRPERVKALVLIDAAGFTGSNQAPLAFRLARHPLGAMALRKITPRKMVKRTLEAFYYDDTKVTSSLVEHYLTLLRREGNRQAFIDRLNTEYLWKTEALSAIKCPVLLQWGQHDPLTTVDQARRFKAAIPQAELQIFPRAGHVPMEEIPQETATAAREFLLNRVAW